MGPIIVPIRKLSCTHALNSPQFSTALSRLIITSDFLPDIPENVWLLPLLIILR
jgi:hypothetical protein